jgi:hypothetical protein
MTIYGCACSSSVVQAPVAESGKAQGCRLHCPSRIWSVSAVHSHRVPCLPVFLSLAGSAAPNYDLVLRAGVCGFVFAQSASALLFEQMGETWSPNKHLPQSQNQGRTASTHKGGRLDRICLLDRHAVKLCCRCKFFLQAPVLRELFSSLVPRLPCCLAHAFLQEMNDSIEHLSNASAERYIPATEHCELV